MTNQQSSYRKIFKATSLFGGVQVVNVLTGVVRSKFVALFLGPSGMGVSSLLSTTVSLIVVIFGMGLNYSVVRYISKAYELNDQIGLSTVLTVFRRWLWISCILGAIFLITFSSLLSHVTFGNNLYGISFALLSVMLIFTLLTNGNTALLQGTLQLNLTAKSTVIGSVLGLATVATLCYFYGVKGIVPALVINAVLTYLISEFFARKVLLKSVEVSLKDTVKIGREMVQLGFVMVLSQIVGSVIIYYVDLYIRLRGSVADVGLYQAGIAITSQSIGLVFSAMAMDYYPRLSAVSNNNNEVNKIVNQQGVITVLVACPLLVSLIVFAPLIINLLLSKEFYVIVNFIRWVAFGTLFTAPSVILGYVALAKGDKKSYFLYCTLLNSLGALIFNIIGYTYGGLVGMGVAICILQVIYVIFTYYKFKQLYLFKFDKQSLGIFAILSMFCLSALIVTQTFNTMLGYITGGLIVCLSFLYSWKVLNEFMGFSSFLKNRLLKNV
jgi:O-antigen/teichoic acid export membrane protein